MLNIAEPYRKPALRILRLAKSHGGSLKACSPMPSIYKLQELGLLTQSEADPCYWILTKDGYDVLTQLIREEA